MSNKQGVRKGLGDGTLMKYWRQAVLAKYQGRCAFTGHSIIEQCECHHIVTRRHKILRWDHRNGIPLSASTYEDTLIEGHTAHGFGHTKLGELRIQETIGDDYEYLCRLQQKTYKDYLFELGITDSEFRQKKKDELLEIIKMGG